MTLREWFELFFGQCAPGAWVNIFSHDPLTDEKDVDWAPVDDLDLLARHVERRAASRDVWFGVASRRANMGPNRGGKADCDTVSAFWVDVDIAHTAHKTSAPLPATRDEALELIHSFHLPPSVIVDSGHGLQPWWILDEPVPVADASPILDCWGATWHKLAADHGWHVDSVFEMARIMRVPGTTNRKDPDSPVEVTVIESTDWRYTLDAIDEWTIDPPAEPERTLSAPYQGAERPGDAFNLTHDGNEILGSLGWTEPRSNRGGDRHWRRPGKTSGMASATVYPDGHTTIWSETTAVETGCETRRPYDPFGLYVALIHHGDFTKASSELGAQGYGTPLERDDLRSLIGAPAGPKAPPSAQPKGAPEPEEVEWSDPSPLVGQLTPPPFPVDALPDWMADHARTAADHLQVPVDLCCQVAIGAFSAAVAGRAKIRLIDRWTDRSTGWLEHLNLFLVTAMASGAGKTPADGAMASALTKFEKERREVCGRARAEAEERRLIMDKKVADARKKAADDGRMDELITARLLLDDTRLPSDGRMLVDDVTPEALSDIMFEQGGRIAMVSSEAQIFDIVCGTYSPKTNLNPYLKGWDGGRLQVDRKGGSGSPKTKVDIPEAVLTVAVCTQPHVIRSLGLKEHQALMGRGFVQRFMISLPDDRRGFRDRRRMFTQADETCARVYDDTFLRIARYMAQWLEPVELKLTPEARQMYADWMAATEERIAPGRDLRHLSEWVAKQQASVGRLAGLLHVAEERGMAAVGADVMARAIRIGEYWAGHASIAAELWHSDAEFGLAQKVLEWLQAKGPVTITLRDLHQGLRHSVSRPTDLLAPLATLVEHGYLAPLFEGAPTVARGIKSPEWALHPSLVVYLEDHVSIGGSFQDSLSPDSSTAPMDTPSHGPHGTQVDSDSIQGDSGSTDVDPGIASARDLASPITQSEVGVRVEDLL